MNSENMTLTTDRKLSAFTIIKRNGKYIKKEKLSFIFSLLFMIVNIILDISLPMIVSRIINYFNENIEFKPIFILVISYFAISVLNQLFFYISTMIIQYAGQRIVSELRMEVFTHIERMSQNQFDSMPVGSLVTRVASYTQAMSDLFTNDLVKLLKNIIKVIGVYSVMMYISYELGLIMLGFILILLLTSAIFSHVSTKVFREERKCVSNLNTYINENISGMKITQIFNQENRKKEEFRNTSESLRKARMKVVCAFAVYRPFITLLYYLSLAIIFYVGLKIKLNAGEIVAFYIYTAHFFNPIEEMADQLNNLNKAFTASERLFNLLDVKPEIRDSEDAIEVSHFEGKIEFKNVWFAYKDEDWILKDVSFTIEPKQTVAFVGATGAGKTTILGLIVRNYEIQRGQILIDGIDITKIKLSSLRHNIGQMLQDVFMFSGSIKSNISLHDDSYSDIDIKAVCDYVDATSFIEKFPDGIKEEVIEHGDNLSQGQKQLISFARTVLHKPQILILDEATANIDTETESIIQNSLEKIKNIGTMLVVAHRLSTVQHADQIIVLQHGEIIERGTHQELIKNNGYYYNLYKLQFENNI
ncbi:MAG: ABC transporter ATP-binding protein [Anaeroplasmataceae bacterium]